MMWRELFARVCLLHACVCFWRWCLPPVPTESSILRGRSHSVLFPQCAFFLVAQLESARARSRFSNRRCSGVSVLLTATLPSFSLLSQWEAFVCSRHVFCRSTMHCSRLCYPFSVDPRVWQQSATLYWLAVLRDDTQRAELAGETHAQTAAWCRLSTSSSLAPLGPHPSFRLHV